LEKFNQTANITTLVKEKARAPQTII